MGERARRAFQSLSEGSTQEKANRRMDDPTKFGGESEYWKKKYIQLAKESGRLTKNEEEQINEPSKKKRNSQ